MIPKVIWQTYQPEYDELPDYIKNVSSTWRTLNPDYEYKYMSDASAEKFILDTYGKDMHELFLNVPVGVMRGDMWRYLVIYEYGGVYTDLDTLCKKPISTWMKDDKSFILCPENNFHLCQWTFAAEPRHPAIKSVIDLMVDRLSNNPDWNRLHFVHYHTGPAVWTDGILKYLGVDNSDEKIIDNSLVWNTLEKSIESGTFCYGGEDWRIFHMDACQHLYGSQNWHDGYEQWIKHPLADKSRPDMP